MGKSIELFKEKWYERYPAHENNADTGEDMFWQTAELVAREYVAALQPSTLPLIEDYKYLLLNFTDCPQIIIDNPNFVKGTIPDEKAFEWAKRCVAEFESNPSPVVESVPLIDKGEPEETVTELCEEGQNIIWLLLPAQKYKGNKDAGRLWEILETIKIINNDTNSR